MEFKPVFFMLQLWLKALFSSLLLFISVIHLGKKDHLSISELKMSAIYFILHRQHYDIFTVQ